MQHRTQHHHGLAPSGQWGRAAPLHRLIDGSTQQRPARRTAACSHREGGNEVAERWAKLRLLEQERDRAIETAQVCSKRSRRLLERVQQLKAWAAQREQAGDRAAAETTVRTRQQVQETLNKTINRAQNNYLLAVRLGDMIGFLQQELSAPPSSATTADHSRLAADQESEQAASQAQAALGGSTDALSLEPPADLTGRGIATTIPLAALPPPSSHPSIEDALAQEEHQEEERQQGEQTSASPSAASAPQRATSLGPESDVATRWTSSTVSSVDLADDWGMSDVAAAFEELSGSPLATALKGYDGSLPPPPLGEHEQGDGEWQALTEDAVQGVAGEEGQAAVSGAWLEAQQAAVAAAGQSSPEEVEEERQGEEVRGVVAMAVAAAKAGSADADEALDSALALLRRQLAGRPRA